MSDYQTQHCQKKKKKLAPLHRVGINEPKNERPKRKRRTCLSIWSCLLTSVGKRPVCVGELRRQ